MVKHQSPLSRCALADLFRSQHPLLIEYIITWSIHIFIHTHVWHQPSFFTFHRHRTTERKKNAASFQYRMIALQHTTRFGIAAIFMVFVRGTVRTLISQCGSIGCQKSKLYQKSIRENFIFDDKMHSWTEHYSLFTLWISTPVFFAQFSWTPVSLVSWFELQFNDSIMHHLEFYHHFLLCYHHSTSAASPMEHGMLLVLWMFMYIAFGSTLILHFFSDVLYMHLEMKKKKKT